jgi:hypothetical protein
MPQFVHLCDSKMVRRIARAGILTTRATRAETGVYCTPVSRDFFRTHQWLRELKRSGVKSIHAVQFRLAPQTLVSVGRFNEEHLLVAAAEAIRIFNEHQDGLGLEIIVPNGVPRSAISRIYVPSQVIGWRYFPGANNKKPFCGCRYCNRGKINAYRVITEPKPVYYKSDDPDEELDEAASNG